MIRSSVAALAVATAVSCSGAEFTSPSENAGGAAGLGGSAAGTSGTGASGGAPNGGGGTMSGGGSGGSATGGTTSGGGSGGSATGGTTSGGGSGGSATGGTTSGGGSGGSATGGTTSGGGSGGSLPTCASLYTGITGVLQVCVNDTTQCVLAVDTDPNDGDAGQPCSTLCAAAGGECLQTYDNGAGACVVDYADKRVCSDATMSEGICICSRGCGGSAPCPSGTKCQGGSCV